MKKKILSLALILMLAGALFVLTGCGETEEKSTSKDSSSSESSDSTEFETSQEEISREEMEVEDIIYEFTDGIAVVKGTDGYYYAIDENGYVIVDCSSKIGSVAEDNFHLSNGYMVYESSKGIKVFDNTGDLVIEYENDDEITYGFRDDISKSGYLSVSVDTDSVTGTTRTFKILDLTGNTLYENDDTNYIYVLDDVFYTHNDDTYTVINVESEKEFTTDGEVEQISDSLFRAGDAIYSTDFEKVATNSSASEITYGYVILDEYYWVEDYSEIKDLSGNVVKDLSDYGGIEQLFEYDDVIYVLTDTEYLYTMDSDFEIITEPVKQSSSYIKKTNYGIYLFVLSSNDGTLIDENLDEVYTIESDVTFYNGTRANYNSWYLYEDFLYSNDNTTIYSAKNKEILTIYK